MTTKTSDMQKEPGYPNDKAFRLKKTWKNGTSTDGTVPAGKALFSSDGKLLSFSLYYEDGYEAPIVLVPKQEWVDKGVKFFDKWLAPIGVTLVAGAFAYEYTKGKNQNEKEFHYTNLAQMLGSGIGLSAINFLTKEVRDSNLVYVNAKTKTIYYDGPIRYNPDSVFG